jgi:integrase
MTPEPAPNIIQLNTAPEPKKKRRPAWPPIKPATKNGRPCFVVDGRINGRGPRYFCATKAEAEGKAVEVRVTRANEGTSGIYNAELAAFGWTVTGAVEFALKHLRSAKKAKPLADAVADFMASKADKSEAYCRDLRIVFDAFKAAAPDDATTATITTDDINTFLTGLHPVTANNRRRNLKVFFAWCVKNKLREDNPAKDANVAKETPETPGILTPEELAVMLAVADKSILPATVIGAFAGLRQAEIKRLDWSDVDLSEGVVTLGAGITKTNSRRTVRLPLAAAAWLEPIAKKRGPVLQVGPEARAAWDLARMAAGFGPFETRLLRVRQANAALTKAQKKALRPWPDNALRHSAISYRMALAPDAAADAFNVAKEATTTITAIESVAYAAGNSPKVIRSHYDALAKPSAAAAWFAVKPSTPRKKGRKRKQ